ncbi:hypothetical protein TRFO_07493 [Tritrichomonas foetus]|uniref:Uncharacterized protein n=1 Tax=Tritrichomonas foetus TaxID=1144522 RepID=A0A1J4JR51_9EUKA|nr:hypothetical protein TRFO_07493 [Tritrichomonas foetus]|eukprot:OHT01593.1 hypothetical protein TRFO_07493 [Tritrichomonas foetus]
MKFSFRENVIEFFGKFPEEHLTSIFNSILFQKWLNEIDETIHLEKIELQTFSLNEKGEPTYIKLDTVSTRFGQVFPRVVVIEGNSFSILMIFIESETKKEYILLEHKFVISTGEFLNVIPYQITNDKVPTQQLVSEYVLNTFGLQISPDKYMDLIQSTVDEKYHSIHPFCGPSFTNNFIFLVKTELKNEEIWKFDNKEVSPNVTLKIIPFDEYSNHVHDMLSMSPLVYYRQYKDKNVF